MRTNTPTTSPSRRMKAAKWAGVGVFLIFLIKGLVWIGIAGVAYWKLRS